MDDDIIDCPACDGTGGSCVSESWGIITGNRGDDRWGNQTLYSTCDDCDGSGRLPSHELVDEGGRNV